MTLLNYLKLIKLNLLKRKASCIFTIIFIAVAVASVITSQVLSSSLTNFFQSSFSNRLLNKTLYISFDENYDKSHVVDSISSLSHISYVLPSESLRVIGYCFDFAGDNKDGELRLLGADEKTLPKIIKGKGFRATDRNVGIIPEKIFPDSNIESIDLRKYSKADFIDGVELIGKTITINYASEHAGFDINYTFEVVGVFDTKFTIDYANVCYIPGNDVASLIEQSYGDEPYIIAFIDDYKNIDMAIQDVKKLGFDAQAAAQADENVPKLFTALGVVLAGVSSMITIIIVLFSTLNSIKMRTFEIGIMKAVGYKNKNITVILLFEVTVLGILGYLTGGFVSLYLLKVIQNSLINGDAMWLYLTFTIKPIALIIALIQSIILPILGCLSAIHKMSKISSAQVLKDGKS